MNRTLPLKKDPRNMRCLSVRQPFAWALVANVKTIENRVWSTDFRGQIALHASTSVTEMRKFKKETGCDKFSPESMPTGAIVGVIDVVDIGSFSPEYESNPFAYGPYCWEMSNGLFLEKPIPLKGKLNLFNLDDAVAAQVEASPKYKLDVTQDLGWQSAADAVTPSLLDDFYQPYISLIDSFLAKAKHLDACTVAAKRLTECCPEDPEGYALLATLDESLSHDEVEALLTRSLQIAPEYPYALTSLGRHYQSQERLDEALAIAQRAVEAEPEGIDALALRSSTLILKGEYPKGLTDANKIRDIAPESHFGYELQAEALSRRGDTTEAIRCVEDGLKVLPNDEVLTELYTRLSTG